MGATSAATIPLWGCTPPLPERLRGAQGRASFRWDDALTLDELRVLLASPDAEVAASWLGTVVRQVRPMTRSPSRRRAGCGRSGRAGSGSCGRSGRSGSVPLGGGGVGGVGARRERTGVDALIRAGADFDLAIIHAAAKDGGFSPPMRAWGWAGSRSSRSRSAGMDLPQVLQPRADSPSRLRRA